MNTARTVGSVVENTLLNIIIFVALIIASPIWLPLLILASPIWIPVAIYKVVKNNKERKAQLTPTFTPVALKAIERNGIDWGAPTGPRYYA